MSLIIKNKIKKIQRISSTCLLYHPSGWIVIQDSD